MKKNQILARILCIFVFTFLLGSCGGYNNQTSEDETDAHPGLETDDTFASDPEARDIATAHNADNANVTNSDVQGERSGTDTQNNDNAGNLSSSDTNNPDEAGNTDEHAQPDLASYMVNLLHPYIYTVRHDFSYETGAGSLYAYTLSASPLLDAKEALQFPNLNQSLNSDYENDTKEVLDELSTLSADGKSALDLSSATGLNYIYYLYYDTSVLRSDDAVLSVDKHFEYYGGGAHGDYGDYAVNYDPSSGNKLSIHDVSKDTVALKDAIKEKLDEQYSNLGLLETDIDTCLDEFFKAQQNGETYRALTFGIGYEGVTFYFNTYSIGSYSNGTQQITLDFAEYSGLFDEKYSYKPDNYISNITNMEKVYADLDQDGKTNEINVTPRVSEQALDVNTYDTLTISLDGRKQDFETYFYSADIYLVKNNSHFYLYVFEHSDNDIVTCKVYDISDGDVIKTDYMGDLSPSVTVPADDGVSGTDLYVEVEMPLTDPDRMELSARLDMLSTYSASRTYAVDEDGSPKSDELFIPDTQMNLTALKDIEVLAVDTDGNEIGENVLIHAQSQVSIYGTDGESYVILSLGDGKYGKISYDKTSWPYRVNGIPEDELFGGMAYAG